MIAADRQHRHLQFSLRDELLIVNGVLREGTELSAKGIVDGTRTRIEPGIVVARPLIDSRRVG
jgi:hypothetical protein